MTHTTTKEAHSVPTLVLPFMKTVRDVFKKMAGVEISVRTPHLKKHTNAAYEVCGIIGFSGDVSGSVVICFPTSAAEKLVEAFAGQAFHRSSPDFSDAIGELVNMIAGSAKAAMGGHTSISIPSVVIGTGYVLSGMSKVKCVVIPCECAHGEFAIEICIERHPGKT